MISIHASLAGGDEAPPGAAQRQGISIHASLAGGDAEAGRLDADRFAFQSTPPSREATLPMLLVWMNVSVFQSTPPSREATYDIFNAFC